MLEGLVPLLSLGTLLIVAVLALIARERTLARMRDPNAPVSTLAKDGKYGGVAFLKPLGEVTSRPFKEPQGHAVLVAGESQQIDVAPPRLIVTDAPRHYDAA